MAFHPWPWMVHGSSIPGQAWSMDGPGMAIATFIPGHLAGQLEYSRHWQGYQRAGAIKAP